VAWFGLVVWCGVVWRDVMCTFVVLTFSKYISHGEGKVIETSKFAEIGWINTCKKTHAVFLSASPMFVPSLSWQNHQF
jgi:hypothetical protein